MNNIIFFLLNIIKSKSELLLGCICGKFTFLFTSVIVYPMILICVISNESVFRNKLCILKGVCILSRVLGWGAPV